MSERDMAIRKVSKDQDVPIPLVAHIISHQFNFVRETMEDGLLDSVLLHNFGSFQVKRLRLDALIRSLIRKIRDGKLDPIKGRKEISKLWKIRESK
jgi:nucleoid DNA-binding protein